MSPMHRVVHRLLLTVTLLCALVSPAAAQSLDFPQPADFDSDRTLAHAYHHRPSDTHDTLERAAIERTGRAAVQALQHLMETATPRSANLRYLPFIAHTTSQ